MPLTDKSARINTEDQSSQEKETDIKCHPVDQQIFHTVAAAGLGQYQSTCGSDGFPQGELYIS